ncbi:MAG TPA: hypothetical protein G4O02_04490 [Caldilineae bacterium]|nr:hypothetical protein [Caldilineae bacterium]
MQNRRIVSYALFALAILLVIIGILVGDQGMNLVLLGLVFLVAGLIFYRRGK